MPILPYHWSVLTSDFKTMAQSLFSVKKLINFIICGIFFLFAYVQLNDPDPYVWIVVYGLVAVLFAVSNFVRIPRMMIQVVILAFALFAFYHVGHFYDWLLSDDKSELFGDMIYDKPYIEGTREFMGLLIAIGALIYLLKRPDKNHC